MSIILPNLILGDASEARDIKFLKNNNITHILCVAMEIKPTFPKTFEYLHIEAKDEDEFPLIDYFDEMVDFIASGVKRQGVVFVHCAFGVSRSPTAVIAYLMKAQKMGFYKAKYFVQDRRREVNPNDGFLKQLQTYEKMLKDKTNENSIASIFAADKDKKRDRDSVKDKAVNPKLKEKKEIPQEGPLKKSISGEEIAKPEIYFKCRKCRSIIFSSTNVVHQRRTEETLCNSIFLDQPEWVMLEKNEEFKLNCPNKKCMAKLGTVKLSGHKCDCGKWIAPAFQIHRKDVDEERARPVDIYSRK